jgi:asparagine synthase (glutamine-hydrolysing)
MTAYALARVSGVVLGTVFHRSGAHEAHSPTFTQAETDKIIATRGEELLHSYWGRYIALIAPEVSPERNVWLVKDPVGRLPCFIAQCDGVCIAFSYMPDVLALGTGAFKINWDFIAARIGLGCGRPDDTALEGIIEVCGGERIELSPGALNRHVVWNLAPLLASDEYYDSSHAAKSLRNTTSACISAWAGRHESFVHRISGGLDSSIVLACLAEAPSQPRITCLTYFRSSSASDERPWARLATRAVDCDHVEHAREPAMPFRELLRMSASPSPPLTSSFLETDPIERQLALQHRATAITTGDGGDSLFGAGAARFAVLEYWRRRGIRAPLLRLASDVALLGNQTVWKVAAQTIHNAMSNHERENTAHVRGARKLAAADIREPMLANRAQFAHPWFRSARFPAGANEILTFLTIPDLFYQPLYEPDDNDPETVFPLLSQPLVELCVSIPSFVHFDEGRDRGLARRAFAHHVPAPILDRTWKDRVQGFPEEILLTNLPYFRELLLDGMLVQKRYLDRKAVAASLSGQAIQETASVGEIIDYVLVESWLQSWSYRERIAA